MIFYAVSVSSLPLIDSQQLSKSGGGGLNQTGSFLDIQQRSRAQVATRGQDPYIVLYNF